jgi:hypothetical protein
MDAARKLRLLCEFLIDAGLIEAGGMIRPAPGVMAAELVNCIDEVIQERDTYRKALSLDGRSSWTAR